MKTIVYCAIHKRTLVNEVLYSILNVAEVCCDIENYRFVVITDMPEEFKLVASIVKMRLGMPIIIEPISKAITENWLGPYRYVYRLRIKALQYYYSKYQENALFIAANMIVLQDLSVLFEWMDEGRRIMYQQGLLLHELLLSPYNPQTKNKAVDEPIRQIFLKGDRADFRIRLDKRHFQGGIIGIPYRDASLLHKVLTINDYISSLIQYHIIEELSYSIVLQETGAIESSKPWFRRYGGEYVRPFLAQRYTCALRNDDALFVNLMKSVGLPYREFKHHLVDYESFLLLLAVFDAIFQGAPPKSVIHIHRYAVNTYQCSESSDTYRKLQAIIADIEQLAALSLEEITPLFEADVIRYAEGPMK